MKTQTLRTWIEIDKKALRYNVGEFFRIIFPATKLMAVIKSNAYGHGLVYVANILSSLRNPASGFPIWFGVDSIVEALRLRREGITNPILVLGFTLSSRMEDAARENISISISNFDALDAVSNMTVRPAVHLKLDTGMHRQGFLDSDMRQLIAVMKKKRVAPEGIFTHFASAKDAGYPTYTLTQLAHFNQALARMNAAGFSNMIRHSAATGGTLLFPDAHLDMVRIGMGLYGYWPSEEAKNVKPSMQSKGQTMHIALNYETHLPSVIASEAKQSLPRNRDCRVAATPRNDNIGEFRNSKYITLKPVLTWKTVISETKRIPKGSFVGYDLTEATYRATIIAVVPIGYWHGYDRGFSGIGHMLVHGHRARVLGRVSMDMTVIDVTDIPNARSGDEVVVIGTQGKETMNAEDFGRTIGTSAYEVLTRINPLIKRIVI